MKRIKSDKQIDNKLKLWEKVFISISILVIVVISSIYLYRLVYFYKLEHPTIEDNTLATHIIKKGTTTTGEGLYTFDSKEYYYKGKDISNYLWYSGKLFRIVNIDDQGITIITENIQTSLVWGIDNDIEESYVYKWLNKTEEEHTGIFIDSINNYEKNLTIASWCVGETTLENNTCNDSIDSYVNLLSISDYLKAGGVNSYLNNNSYWWTSNTSKEGKAWYIFNTGGINNEVSSNDTYYSYGVRPVIKLTRNTIYLKGDGTKENPYQIEEEISNELANKSIGEYIKFSNYNWRIQSKDESSLKLILDGYITSINQTTKIKYSNIEKYLNNTFYNTLSKNNLNKCDYYNGEYNKDTQYNYQNIYTKNTNGYLGLPSIGELFVNDYENIWLYNSFGSASLQYKTINANQIIADIKDNENYIRPIVCIKNNINILSGEGTKNNPYLLEE